MDIRKVDPKYIYLCLVSIPYIGTYIRISFSDGCGGNPFLSGLCQLGLMDKIYLNEGTLWIIGSMLLALFVVFFLRIALPIPLLIMSSLFTYVAFWSSLFVSPQASAALCLLFSYLSYLAFCEEFEANYISTLKSALFILYGFISVASLYFIWAHLSTLFVS